MNTLKTFRTAILASFVAICTTGYAQNNANESAVPKEQNAAAANQSATEDDNNVFFIVEKMPQFPNGDIAMRKYIAENIVYPQEAKDKKIQGKVFVTFVIGKDGAIEPESVKIAVDSDGNYRGADPLLDAEAIRVIKTLPKWKPGTQGGKPLRVSYTVPVAFEIK